MRAGAGQYRRLQRDQGYKPIAAVFKIYFDQIHGWYINCYPMYFVERALLVDDDELIRYAVTKALHPYCSELKSVSSESEALHEISSSRYQLCLLDIGLRGMDGLALPKTIKEISPDTKVVIMTGITPDDKMRKEISDCSFCFLSKPFEIAELKAVAKYAFGRHEAEPSDGSGWSGTGNAGKSVNYAVTVLDQSNPVNLSLKGDMLDISESGISMRTPYPLELGHLITFTSGLERPETRKGIVKWTMIADESYMYRVGVEFVNDDKGRQQPPAL
jgi:DNA-binding response OmpR family regulator